MKATARVSVIKKTLLLILVFTVSTSLCGCWNYREIEMLAAVYSFGIDKGPKGKGYTITVEVSSLETSGKNSKLQPVLLSAEGNTIMGAAANLTKISNNIIYWSQAKVGIISKDVAQEGVRELVDMLLRDSETRIDMYLVVSREKTAKQIMMLSMENPTEMLGVRLAQLIENQRNLSKAPMMKVFELSDMLVSSNQSGVLGVVGIDDSNEEKIAELSGAAIFHDDNMVGILEGNETQYLMLAMNEFTGGYIVIEGIKESSKVRASIQVNKSKTSIKPLCENGRIHMDINVKSEGGIVELYNPDNIEDAKVEMGIKKRCEEIISEETQKIIQRVQDNYGVDVFGFSNAFIKRKPSLWNKLSKNWNEEFSNMGIRVHSNVHITTTGEVEILSEGDV